MGLCCAGKFAIPLVALDLGAVASKPFRSYGGGEKADGEQWNELAPAHAAARLNCTADEFQVEPHRIQGL